MAIEQTILAVGPVAFTSNGSDAGVITLVSTLGFKTKSIVTITANTLPALQLEVKRVYKNRIVVGPPGNIKLKQDLTLYTVALQAQVEQIEQERWKVALDDQNRATYEQEPTLARRVIMVDPYGNFYDTDNPLKVQLSDGSINIGTVNANVNVQLTDKESAPGENDYDITRIGDGENELIINPDGSINTNTYDKIFALLTNANFLKLGNFDQIIPTFSGNIVTISYYESGAKIAQAQIRYINSTDWDMSLQAYINNDDGEILEEDSDEPLLLE